MQLCRIDNRTENREGASRVKCPSLSQKRSNVPLSFHSLTPRVKLWVIQLLFFNRTLKCDHSLESCWCCLFFDFSQFVIWGNLSILDLELLGVRGLKNNECITGKELSNEWSLHGLIYRQFKRSKPRCVTNQNLQHRITII